MTTPIAEATADYDLVIMLMRCHDALQLDVLLEQNEMGLVV
jgi:hypothetical protein